MEATSGVETGVLGLPDGGGGLRSIGDTFEPDLLRGTGNYAVPIDAPAGPNGLKPGLTLRYSTGLGNGPLGMGWQVAGPLSIVRSTDRGVPGYDEDDDLLLAGDVLVPVGGGRYRPRADSRGWDIRRDGEGWRIRTKDGRTYVLGTSANARQEADGRVLAWLCESEIDNAGNAIRFSYHHDGNQAYIAEIGWGIWFFRILYETRPDVLLSGRAGFEVRTEWRATRIERHCTRAEPSLCAAYQLSYDVDPAAQLSLLASIELQGFDADGAMERFPALRFEYERFAPQPRLMPLAADDGRLPFGRSATALVDMDGDGLPDLLQTGRGGHRLWRNRGEGQFAAGRALPFSPSQLSLGQHGVTFVDLDGDGAADLVRADSRLRLALRNRADGNWDDLPQVLRQQFPLSVTARSSRLVDLTGNGLADLLQSGPNGFMLAYNLGDGNWSAPAVIARRSDTAGFPDIDLADDAIHLLDMTGDGLADIVEIHPGSIAYWPSLGHGRFGARVDMAKAPVFGKPFRRDRLLLGDLDGSGTCDLVYVDFDRIFYWLNRSGQGWSERLEVPFVPPPDLMSLTLVDLLGTGRQGLCWARRTDGEGRFLDLAGGGKPYLLRTVDNGFGARTRIDYSTTSALRADAPEDWTDYLPFPLHVVTALVSDDATTGETTRTHIRYRDGRYDPVARCFRGFEQVDVTSVGDAHTPTTIRRVTFALGTRVTPGQRSGLSAEERLREQALAGAMTATELLVEREGADPATVSRTDCQWAARLDFADGDRFVFFPHLTSTSIVSFAADGTSRIDTASYDYDQFGNVTRKRRATRFGDEVEDAAIIGVQEIDYAVAETAWLVGLPARIATRAADGELLDDRRIFYDGPALTGLPAGQIERGLVRRSEELALSRLRLPADYADRIAPDWGFVERDEGWYRVVEAFDHDSAGNRVAQADGLGRLSHVAYDADRQFAVRTEDAAGRVTEAEFDPRVAQPIGVTTPEGLTTRYAYSPLGRTVAQFDTTADGSLQLTQVYTVTHAAPAGDKVMPARAASVRPLHAGATLDAILGADLDSLTGASIAVDHFDGRGNVLQRSRRASTGEHPWIAAARRRYTRNNQPATDHPNVFAPTMAFVPPDPDDPGVRYRYDPSGQCTRVEHPDGSRLSMEYRLRSILKRDGETADDAPPTVELYDALGRLAGVDTPDGTGALVSTRYTLDHAGRILSVTDGGGAVTTRHLFAGPGPAIRIDHIIAGTRTSHFDASGALRLRLTGDAQAIAFEYDVHGRVTHATDVRDPTAPVVLRALTFDTTGLVRCEEMGIVTTLTNDRLGRPVRKAIDFGGGHVLAMERVFGLQGELRALTYPDGSTVALDYHDAGQVRALPGLVADVAYDAHDDPVRIAFGSGVEVGYTYDPAMKRLNRIALRAGDTALRQLDFAHDRNGCIVRCDDAIGGQAISRSYAYDPLLRLTRCVARQGLGQADELVLRDDHYAYGPTGDLLANAESGETQYRYADPLRPGLLTGLTRAGQEVPLLSDATGRLAAFDAIAKVDYDPWDRIKAMHLVDGSRLDYAYDSADRLIRRVLVRPDGSRDETRLFDGVYEESAAGSRSDIYVGKLRVASRRTAPDGSSATALVMTDHLGSILSTCTPTGAAARHQAYSPFGLPLLPPSPDMCYTGAEGETLAGLIHLGSRWYHPGLGRFVTPDWFVIENPTRVQRLPQALNVYSYAINNPVMLRDPTGKFFGLDDAIVAGVGFAVGFVVGVVVGIAEGRSFGDTMLLGLEAGLLGAAGAWLAYATMGAALAGMGALGLGVGSGVATGLTIGAAVVGGLNGVISGSLEIYNWKSPKGWVSFLADSTWGMLGTSLGLVVHGVNLFYDRKYSFALSHRQNRHVYDGGFGFGHSAFTEGNVTSNLRGRRDDLVNHETLHIWQSRIFGPIFPLSYAAWLVAGGTVGLTVGLFLWAFGEQGLGTSIKDVAYYDNPWESWAYQVGGGHSGKGGVLSWA